MDYEKFVENFNELSTDNKVQIFNDFCINYGNSDDTIYVFDEDFFNMAFANPMDAARATFFGKIESWNDEYIRFNAYGNLESLSEYSVEGEIEYVLEEIFEHKDVWEGYIEEEDDDEDDEEDDLETNFVCPKCGHVFEQGEWNYNYDTALLDFKCPECDLEGNEKNVNVE